MKPLFALLSAATLAFALSASAQNAPAPHAWGDKNKDGICDVTGKPVGQGRAWGAGRGRGRGQMAGSQFAGRGGPGRWNQGRGRRCGGCCGNAAAQPAPPAQPAPAPPAK